MSYLSDFEKISQNSESSFKVTWRWATSGKGRKKGDQIGDFEFRNFKNELDGIAILEEERIERNIVYAATQRISRDNFIASGHMYLDFTIESTDHYKDDGR